MGVLLRKCGGSKRESMLKRVLRDGGPGYCNFVVTDACNGKCKFCNFSADIPARERKVYVPLYEACAAIDVLVKNGIGYICFVGGEPTLHPGLPDMIAHAKELGVRTLMVTNGMLLTHDRIDLYVRAGLNSAIISVDAPDVSVHESNRGMAGLCDRIADANRQFCAAGVSTTASVALSRLLGDMDMLPGFLEFLGFDKVTFSYPVKTLPSNYRAYSSSDLVDFTDDELYELYERVKLMKRRFRVVNPTASLEEMQRFLRKKPQMFPCLAGYKYFHLDWNLNLWRCQAWHKPICSVFDMNESMLERDGCTRCMIDCYRDGSVLQYVAVALYDARQDISRLRLRQAAGRILSKPTLHSLRAVLEGLKWIRQL